MYMVAAFVFGIVTLALIALVAFGHHIPVLRARRHWTEKQ